MKRTLTLALLLTGCAVLVSLIYTDLPSFSDGEGNIQVTASSSVQVGGNTIRVSVADTPEKREKGLSGREGLLSDEGMLFTFEDDGYYAFWMKDMRFPIDILWISRGGTIVDMQENVSPETYPAAFAPRTKARYVVELPAGYVEEHAVRIGDIVRL